MPQRLFFLSRIFYKVLRELLLAAIASMIGAVALNYYTHTSVGPPHAAVEPVANAEIMQIVRDEHSLITDYLKRQSEAEQKSNRSAEDDMLKSKALQQATLLNSNELRVARAKAIALLHRDEANSIRRTPAPEPQRQPTPAAEHEPLQLVHAATIGPPMEAADHPIPPALIPNAASSLGNNTAVERSSSRFAGIERIRF
jgi:hypothetical protein